MKFESVFIAFMLLIASHGTNGSLINDFLSGAKSFWPKTQDVSTELKKFPDVDFELPPEKDEFIKQGLDTINAPKGALDICSHRVVMQLKKNCNQLTMEEIGKLAIMLMNCQLTVENRPKLPCTPEMSLHQCTTAMDKNTYQIYQILTHRAVGICTALKHDQFRALTEMTVNRLMEVTQGQTSAIHEQLQNQKRINEIGLQNIREFEEYQEKIKEGQLKTHEELTKAAEIIEELNFNIQKEVEWKKKSVEQMIEMDKTTSEIKEALDVTNRHMIAHYQEALDFLDNFKSMMDLVATFSNNVQGSFLKFQSVMKEIGIDITAEFFVLLIIDAFYFIFGMIFIIFMGLSNSAYKFILMSLTIFNALAAYYKADVSIAGTNILVWVSYIMFYQVLPVLTRKIANLTSIIPEIIAKLVKAVKLKKKQESDTESENEDANNNKKERERSKTPFEKVVNGLFKSPRKILKSSSDDDKEMEDIYANQILTTPKSVPKHAETPVLPPRAMSPALLRVRSEIQAERAATPFLNQKGRVQCCALTNKGLQCKNASVEGFDKCRVHNL